MILHLSLSSGKLRQIVEERLSEMGHSQDAIDGFFDCKTRQYGFTIIGIQMAIGIALMVLRRFIPETSGPALLLAPLGAACIGFALATSMRCISVLRE